MENQDNFNMQDGSQPIKPSNNMALTIVGTILGCCSTFGLGFIVGIVGIVFASQVNNKYNSGDYEGAEKSAKYARILGFIAIGLFVLNIIYTALNWDTFMEQYHEAMEQIEAAQGQ